MKKLFLITDDAALEGAVEACAHDLEANVDRTDNWAAARERLVKERYDAVCIDYDAMKIEGLDAFILLDNILEKEKTPGVLVLRRVSERAREFIDSLDSFRESIELGDRKPTADRLASRLERMLREAPAAPGSETSEADDAPVEVQVRLPSLTEGSLGQVELGRLLYALAQARLSGVLHLRTDAIERRYAIIEGAPVRAAGRRYSDLETLASAFAWQEGDYRFEERSGGAAETVDPLSFIYQSLDRHLPQRRVMQAMMHHMQSYPTVSNLWAQRRGDLEQFGVVARFIEACDGQTTLERALADLGSDATAGFKASLFSRQTDLVLMRGEPTPGGVQIRYEAKFSRARREQIEADKKASKAYRAAGTGRLDLEEELREYLADIEQATPYEIFDVWEGCGRQVIQEKFYAMVKSHHPDVYGGNVSGDVKRLAQEIFIAIKDAYTELLKVEDEQVRPDPRREDGGGLEASSEALTDTTITEEVTLDDEPAGSDSGSGRRTTDAERSTHDQFGADKIRSSPGQTSSSGAEADQEDDRDAARRSRVERLKAKRRSTPIGLGRQPSSPIVEGKSRKSDPRRGTEERRAKIDKIRRNSTVSSPTKGDGDPKAEQAKTAFNQGYKAFREAENEKEALEYFSRAYNLEPGNGKYMTFYGYLLFLNEPERRDEAEKVLRKAIEIGDRQSLPDAHVFLGHILKVKEMHDRALTHFKKALELNPKSREAQREIRLHHMRKNEKSKSGGESFFKNLFKK